MTRLITLALTALALAACATDPRPSPESNLSGFAPGAGPRGPSSVVYDCPEVGTQIRCRVPKYATVGDLIAGERLVQP